MKKILLLRPGALGDVVITRVALAALRATFPAAKIGLLATAPQGLLLVDFRLADFFHDFSSARFAWLFGDGSSRPPEALREIFRDADGAFLYSRDPGQAIAKNIQALGCRQVVACPPRPAEDGSDGWAYRFILRPVEEFLRQQNYPVVAPASSLFQVSLPQVRAAARGLGKRYAVLHPGSGGVRKNWPLERFAEVGQRLARTHAVAVTCGEADGEAGQKLVRQIEGAALFDQLELPELAALLAGAEVYVGNDSGVSHLAAAVSLGERKPDCRVVFGPTLAEVWLPPGARAFRGEDSDAIASTLVWPG
jgi:heptosyltransferase-2